MIALLWLCLLLIGLCLSRSSSRGGEYEECRAYGPDESTIDDSIPVPPVDLYDPELSIPAGYVIPHERGRTSLEFCESRRVREYQPRLVHNDWTVPAAWMREAVPMQ